MIDALFLAALIVTVVSYRAKRRLTQRGRSQGVGYGLARAVLQLAAMFTGVALVFLLLSIRIEFLDWDGTTLDRLYAFQGMLESIQRGARAVKPSAGMAVVVLLLLFGVSMSAELLRGRLGRISSKVQALAKRLSSGFSRYSRIVGVAYGALMLLCSFTFFSSELSEGLGRLELRIKTIEEETVKQGSGLLEVLRDQVEEEVIDAVIAEAPADFTQWLEEQARTHTELDELQALRKRAEEVGTRPIPVSRVEAAARRAARALDVALSEADIRPVSERPAATERVRASDKPGELSVQSLESLGRQVTDHRSDLRGAATAILEMESRPALTKKGLKYLVRRSGLTEALAEAHPLLPSVARIVDGVLADMLHRLTERAVFEPLVRRLATAGLERTDAKFTEELKSSARDLVLREGRVAQRWRAEQGMLKSMASTNAEHLASISGVKRANEVEVRRAEAKLEERRSEMVRQVRADSARLVGNLFEKRGVAPVAGSVLESLSPSERVAEVIRRVAAAETERQLRPRVEPFPFKPRTNRFKPFTRYPGESNAQSGDPKTVKRVWQEDAARYIERLLKRYEAVPVTLVGLDELAQLREVVSDSSEDALRRLSRIERIANERFALEPIPRYSQAEIVNNQQKALEFERLMTRVRNRKPGRFGETPGSRRRPPRPPRPRPRGRP